jgi:hypothetical protein
MFRPTARREAQPSTSGARGCRTRRLRQFVGKPRLLLLRLAGPATSHEVGLSDRDLRTHLDDTSGGNAEILARVIR